MLGKKGEQTFQVWKLVIDFRTGPAPFDRMQLTAPSRKPIIGTLALRGYTWPLRDTLRNMNFQYVRAGTDGAWPPKPVCLPSLGKC